LKENFLISHVTTA